MTSEEFLKAYANTPLDKRFKPLDIIHLGMDTTLEAIYRTVEIKNNGIRELTQERQDVIDLAEKFLTPNA